MAKFCTFASSSSGNSAYISSADGGVLVDAGISCKRILEGIVAVDGDIKSLKAIFITHEHTDHISGLNVLLKKVKVPLYATAPVLNHLVAQNLVPENAQLIPLTNKMVELGAIGAMAFATNHDSAGSVGFKFMLPNNQNVAVATDLGEVTDEVLEGLLGAQTILLESNYDPVLLKMCSYPSFLKNRISSTNGHLENAHAASLATKLLENGTTRFMLGHLSRESNNPHLAKQATLEALTEMGACADSDFSLSVAPYNDISSVLKF